MAVATIPLTGTTWVLKRYPAPLETVDSMAGAQGPQDKKAGTLAAMVVTMRETDDRNGNCFECFSLDASLPIPEGVTHGHLVPTSSSGPPWLHIFLSTLQDLIPAPAAPVLIMFEVLHKVWAPGKTPKLQLGVGVLQQTQLLATTEGKDILLCALGAVLEALDGQRKGGANHMEGLERAAVRLQSKLEGKDKVQGCADELSDSEEQNFSIGCPAHPMW